MPNWFILLVYVTTLIAIINFITIGVAYSKIEKLKEKIKELKDRR